jgi:hypothetical protein
LWGESEASSLKERRKIKMPRYSETVRAAVSVSKLVAIAQSEVDRLRLQFHDVPKDYLDFLKELGWGEVGDMSFQLYSGLVMPKEVYDEVTAAGLDDILLFGDDFQGYSFGFARNDRWAVVEVNPNTGTPRQVAENFENFVHRWLIGDTEA